MSPSEPNAFAGQLDLDLLQWSNPDFVQLRTLLVSAYDEPNTVRSLFTRVVPEGDAGVVMIAEIAWDTNVLAVWHNVLESSRNSATLSHLLSLVASDLTRLSYRSQVKDLGRRLRVPVTVTSGAVTPDSWIKLLAIGLGVVLVAGSGVAAYRHFQSPPPAKIAQPSASAVLPQPSSDRGLPTPPPPPPNLEFAAFAAPDPKGIVVTLNVASPSDVPLVADGVILLPSTSERSAVLLTKKKPPEGAPKQLSSDPAKVAQALEKVTDDGLLAFAETYPALAGHAREIRLRRCKNQLEASANAIGSGREACNRLRTAVGTLDRCKQLGLLGQTNGEIRINAARGQLPDCR